MTILNKTRKGVDAETAWARSKNSGIKFLFFLFGVIAAIVGISIYFLNSPSISTVGVDECEKHMYITQTDVQLSSKSKQTFDLEFAITPTKQESGLSLRECMPKYSAMVFLYATDDKFGIWMKNMNFAIDVVWLDKDKKIVTIVNDMQPSSYPKIHYPTEDARYVIEVRSGVANEVGFAVGDTLSW